LKLGTNILMNEEGVKVNRIYGHGGLFKTKGVGQSILAAALNVPVAVMKTAGEGGAWGIALLAAYAVRQDESLTLAQFLDKQVFSKFASTAMPPDKDDAQGFAKYMDTFKASLAAQKAAVEAIH
jgi:sugar (pentulose or hexulose) kinase